MPIPREVSAVPPAALVPIPPVVVEHSSVHGWHICATWNQGLDSGSIGHLYVMHVLAAAATSREVWEALAEATLAGLCIRCSPLREHEHLLDMYVREAVVEQAAFFTWAHAPVLNISCGGCDLGRGTGETVGQREDREYVEGMGGP